MTRIPKTIAARALPTAALARMEGSKITSLVIVDEVSVVRGVLHIHDLWRTQMF